MSPVWTVSFISWNLIQQIVFDPAPGQHSACIAAGCTCSGIEQKILFSAVSKTCRYYGTTPVSELESPGPWRQNPRKAAGNEGKVSQMCLGHAVEAVSVWNQRGNNYDMVKGCADVPDFVCCCHHRLLEARRPHSSIQLGIHSSILKFHAFQVLPVGSIPPSGSLHDRYIQIPKDRAVTLRQALAVVQQWLVIVLYFRLIQFPARMRAFHWCSRSLLENTLGLYLYCKVQQCSCCQDRENIKVYVFVGMVFFFPMRNTAVRHL